MRGAAFRRLGGRDFSGQNIKSSNVYTLMSKRPANHRQLVKWLFVTALSLIPVYAAAQNDAVKIPEEVKPFVEKGMIPIALEASDLNADGRKDFLLVLSPIVPEGSTYDEAGDGARPLLILIRDANGALSVAARNDMVVLCKNCGGVFGDPFAGIDVRGTRFTVNNYGGSNDRWSYSYTFDYSRRDRTWQLVRVEESSFQALDPKRTERTHIYTPPRDFGLINFADFDPDNYRKKGKK
jgi:hypothetical protein